MGLNQDMNPANAEMMTVDPTLGTFLASKAAHGEVKQSEIATAVKSEPAKFMEFVNKLGFAGWADQQTLEDTAQRYSPQIAKAEEQATAREAALERAKAQAKAGANKGDAQQARFDAQRQIDLSKELVKNKIPQISSVMNKADSVVPGGLDGWKPGMPLPGVDGLDSRTPINNLKGQALKLRQAAEGAKNMIMAQISGQNVTEGEAIRVLGMLGMAPAYDQQGILKDFALKGNVNPEAFVGGMQQVRQMMDGVVNTYRAGYGDNYDVVMSRLKNGAQTSIIKSGGGKSTGPGITVYGKTMTKDQWKQFKVDHPDDPANDAITKAIGE